MRNNKGKLLKSKLLSLKPRDWNKPLIKSNIFALMGMYERMPDYVKKMIDEAKNELVQDHVRDPYKKEPYSKYHSYVSFDESPNMEIREYRVLTARPHSSNG